MDYLPLFFKLKNRTVLLVGGGRVALRKASLLDKAGAQLIVVSREVDSELKELIDKQQGKVIVGEYHHDVLDGVDLVIAATNDKLLNAQVCADATDRHIPVSVVNNTELSGFIFPAIIDRSPIVIGVSSGGGSPVLSRLLRAKIETWIPQSYSWLGELVERFSKQVSEKFTRSDDRDYFWTKVLHGAVAEKVFAGQKEDACNLIKQALDEDSNANGTSFNVGEVYLVGGGPGDPELLTFKALRLMQQADVVLYDQLVSAEVLALCHPDIEKINVGKRCGNHSVPQERTNELLVELAQQGKRVLRLKGGDPFVFGRGGEELQTLKKHQIPFQVVPGITAASACSTSAGIPLTHRDYAQSVRLVTGHLKNDSADLNFPELVQADQTVVFYMGLQNLPYLFNQLIAHGRSPETPAAIVSRGSTDEQKVLTGTLTDLPSKQQEAQLPAPALIIVGEVVSLHKDLAWYGEEVLHNHGLVMPESQINGTVSGLN